jgi:F-type H+-transporting ATPase subunit delta
MIASKITHRYAKALLDLAITESNLDACYADMKLIEEVCAENSDFVLLLKSPIINMDKKISIINEIFGKKLSKITSLFINIITNKKRESLIPLIAQNFIALHKTHNKIATAKVITASPLDEGLRAEVSKYVKSKTDFNIDLIEEIDEAIIGGAIIKMGDQQLDGSVRRNIKELKNTYNKNLYIKDF